MGFELKAPIAESGIAWRALIATLTIMAVTFFGASSEVQVVPSLALLGLIGFAVLRALRHPTKPSAEPHAIVADATGLVIDGQMAMPRAAIARAYAVKALDGAYAVHFKGAPPSRSCTVFAPSAEDARALLAAINLEPSISRATFRALSPSDKYWRWVAVTALFLSYFGIFSPFSIGIFAAFCGVALLSSFVPQHVEVGQDGILLAWLGKKRFISFGIIEAVSATERGVVLALRNGQSAEVRLTHKSGNASEEVERLCQRIAEEMEAYETRAHLEQEALLVQGNRDLETWMREMRSLGSGEGAGYRDAAITSERLWDIVDNPSADPSARQGAALALHPSLDDDARARLLEIARCTASPRLRIALEGVVREREPPRLRLAFENAESELPWEDDVDAELESQRHLAHLRAAGDRRD